jgi:hypothetical protein
MVKWGGEIVSSSLVAEIMGMLRDGSDPDQIREVVDEAISEWRIEQEAGDA